MDKIRLHAGLVIIMLGALAAGAQAVFRRILEGRSWASFGYIAAEAEMAWEMIH